MSQPDSLAGYPGSKAAGGVCERIIRQMPPHTVYIEAFAGHAAVYRRKRLAAASVLIDEDPGVCRRLRGLIDRRGDACCVFAGDALQLLPSLPAIRDRQTLLYCDPPYLIEVRTRLLYQHEFETPEQHKRLLELLLGLPCMVMISGYASDLYRQLLSSWRTVEIPAMTRGGMRTEVVWMNFPEPSIIHDTRFAGRDFRERERIKRKARRWVEMYQRMQPRERQAIAEELARVDRPTMSAAMEASDGSYSAITQEGLAAAGKHSQGRPHDEMGQSVVD